MSGVSVVLVASTMVPPVSVITTSSVSPRTVTPGLGRENPMAAVEDGRTAAGDAAGGASVGPKIIRGSTAALIASAIPTPMSP